MTEEQKQALMQGMEEAGELAEAELELLVAQGVIAVESMAQVASWMERWYLRAGYKRLSKAIMRGL